MFVKSMIGYAMDPQRDRGRLVYRLVMRGLERAVYRQPREIRRRLGATVLQWRSGFLWSIVADRIWPTSRPSTAIGRAGQLIAVLAVDARCSKKTFERGG